MAKHDPNYTPEGEDAQTADLPDALRITGAIHTGGPAPFTRGMEAAFAQTAPSVADVKRLVEAGALGAMDRDGNVVPFKVKAAAAEASASSTPAKKAPAKKGPAKTPADDDAAGGDAGDDAK